MIFLIQFFFLPSSPIEKLSVVKPAVPGLEHCDKLFCRGTEIFVCICKCRMSDDTISEIAQ